MKLYEIPRGSFFKLVEDTETPPGGIPSSVGETYFLNSIDGMYSLCLNSKREIVHLAAWSDVEITKES